MVRQVKRAAVFIIGLNCWLWYGSLVIAQSDDLVRGERLYQRCYACHSLAPDEKPALQGPSLYGIIGRRAASLANFSYSPALTAKSEGGLVWTEDDLDQFLSDPERVIPGNQMGFFGLPDARDRSDLIAYLKNATRHRR
jgi:cytochrome c